MSHAVIEFQIISPVPQETTNFYTSLFDWTIDANNALGYRRIVTGSTDGIQGGIWPAPPQSSTFVQLFIRVGDIETTLARATGLGAKVVIPVTALPDGERMAVLHDPQGMSFGLFQPKLEPSVS